MLLALVLLAACTLLVFVPPAGGPPAPLLPDAPLVERLFPGVPAWWLGVRLFGLLAAAVLAVSASPAIKLGDSSSWAGASAHRDTPRVRLWVALGLAVLQITAGLWASHFSRTAQLIYVAGFAIPPLVLVAGRRSLAPPGARDWRTLLIVAVVVIAWLLLRLPIAWRSPRAADGLDTWVGLQQLAHTDDPRFNLLTGRFFPGAGSLYLMLEGAGLLSFFALPPSFQVVQAAHFLWLAVAGMAVGLLARRWIGKTAAPIATAVFLFSPFALMMLLIPLALSFGSLVTVGLLALFMKVHHDRSLGALAALGALAGIGATQPAVAPVSVIAFGAAIWSARQHPPLPMHTVIIAALSFSAAAVTGLPDAPTIQSMATAYTRGRAEWVGHEMAGFGQISPSSSEYLVETATPRLFDTPISALLAPFALPRIPIRMLGDTLFDPVGSGLSAIGIAACLRAMPASRFAQGLLVALFVGILPACLASADRISALRLFVIPVPVALLAAVGWETIRRRFDPLIPRAVTTAAATTAIALGGIAVFDCVNPQILASSWVSLTLRALASGTPAGGTVVLDHPDPHSFPYWYLNEVMAVIPRQPIAVRVYDRPASLWERGAGSEPAVAELYFWSPGLEEDRQVSRAVCQRWPSAALYTLHDRAQRSRVFAARPQGPAWRPALPQAQWQVQGCDAELQTEATWADDVVRQADVLSAQGRQREAVAVLRAAARRNFAQARLFETTARALLESPADARNPRDAPEGQEAILWAMRACQVTRFRDAGALTTLATAYAAAGRFRQAIDTARQAREIALTQGNDGLVAQLDTRLRDYASSVHSR